MNIKWLSGGLLVVVAALVVAHESGLGNRNEHDDGKDRGRANHRAIVFADPGPLTGAVGTTITNIASSDKNEKKISYTSSDAAIATVDSKTGVVNLLAVGSVTITASKPNQNIEPATYLIAVTPGVQAIAFAQAGPVNVLLGSQSDNTAMGGVGTGAVTYASSNTNAVAVDPTSGAVTATGVGSAIITATKAADANYLQAQSSYTINSQTANKISAFIGAAATAVSLPASANGKQFVRARVADCTATDTVATCAGAETDAVNATTINDGRATLSTPALYAIADGAVGAPIDVSVDRFSSRIGHAATYFKNRYWVIGGGEPIIPGGTPVQYKAKADVWSSADGKTWKLETADAGFGTRWFHNAVAYNDRIWVISGSGIPAQTPLPWYSDVWSSADGVNWRLENANANFPWWSTDLNIVVFNNEMLAVSGGRVYTSTNGVFTLKAPSVPALTGTTLGRMDATLTVYNNQLWYIGGKVDYPINVPQTGSATNDVWRSSDGITWTQVLANGSAPFAPRHRHAAFVTNGKLWVMGGQGATAGVGGPVTGDAWSTTDGVNWTKENMNGIARTYLAKVIQEPSKATLIGGLQYGFANNVWQSADGSNWSEQSSTAQFSSRTTRGVEFKGQMWIAGGAATDGGINDRDNNEVWRSSDGVNWSRVATNGPIFTPRDSHSLTVFNDRLWIIGGWNNPTGGVGTQVYQHDVWSSADGVSWTQETNGPAFTPRIGQAVTVLDGRMWLIGGFGATGYLNDVWSSTDGVNWTSENPSAAFSGRSAHRVAAFNDALWLIDGENAVGGMDEIWRSVDGINWTQQTAGPHFAARTRFDTAVLNGRIYVIGGVSDGNYNTGKRYNDVWSSADGLNWIQDVEHAPFAARSSHTVVTHNNELWLIGGFGAGLFNDVWRSSDGINWRVGFSSDIASP